MTFPRTLPPAAAPLSWRDLASALAALAAPGRTLRARERELREYFGVRHVVLTSSGTAALTVALQALRFLSQRQEVVIPAYTCPSVPAAVLRARLKPVLCDVSPRTFDFDYRQLGSVAGDQTLAIVAQHPFGVVTNVSHVRALAKRRGAFVVEDAAQAMGAVAGRRLTGTSGDIGVYSLGRGKAITSGGGGIAVTNVAAIARALRAIEARLDRPTLADIARQFAVLACMTTFSHPRLYWVPASLPMLGLGETVYPKRIALKRLSALQAGSLEHWRERLAEAARVRMETVSYFQRELGLSGTPMPCPRLPLLVSDAAERDRLQRYAAAHGLGLGLGYPCAVHEVPELRPLFGTERHPGAEALAARLVTVPTHRYLSPADRQALVDCLRTAAVAAMPSREWRKAS